MKRAIIIIVITIILGAGAVVAALRLREAQAPTAPKSKPKAASELSAIVEGPTIAKTGDTLSYKGTATGQKLSWIRIYWIENDNDLGEATKWGPALASNDNCGGTATCSVTAPLTPTNAGTNYIAVTVSDQTLGQCSGNPLVDNITDKATSPVKGWIDCGANDRVSLTVSQSGDVLTESPLELAFSVQAAAATPTPSPTPTPPAGVASPTPTPPAGVASPTPTPGAGGVATPSPKASPTPKAPPTPKAQASPSPSSEAELPVAGVNVPTAVGIMGGIMLLLLGLALAL